MGYLPGFWNGKLHLFAQAPQDCPSHAAGKYGAIGLNDLVPESKIALSGLQPYMRFPLIGLSAKPKWRELSHKTPKCRGTRPPIKL